jgi:multisubunit Na+/H+ antiporter MnhG subunit
LALIATLLWSVTASTAALVAALTLIATLLLASPASALAISYSALLVQLSEERIEEELGVSRTSATRVAATASTLCRL